MPIVAVRDVMSEGLALGARTCGEVVKIWIGNEHPDSLFAYPDVANLSGCLEPIRVERSLSPVARVHEAFQCRPLVISHVIPLQLFQDLKSHRWNHAVLSRG